MADAAVELRKPVPRVAVGQLDVEAHNIDPLKISIRVVFSRDWLSTKTYMLRHPMTNVHFRVIN